LFFPGTKKKAKKQLFSVKKHQGYPGTHLMKIGLFFTVTAKKG